MKQFCTSVKIRLEQADDFDSKRELLKDIIEKVIYKPHHVTIIGSVPVKVANSQNNQVSYLPFRIESEIEKAIIYGKPRTKYPEDGRLMAYGSAGRFKIISRNPLQRIRLPVGPMGPRKRRKETVTA
jgi:hypothetical protein